jgi:UDP-N-acetylmuramoyl-L-alanyl-D-glutamate--2,6-diaminopimelate ligase
LEKNTNMKLDTLLSNLKILKQLGNTNQEVTGLAFDSRKVASGFVFFAISGTQVDGHQFIAQVIEAGANTIVCEVLPEQLQEAVCYLQVASSAEALGYMASNYYGEPSKKLNLVGVTGTNGKTSTVTLLFNLFRGLGYNTGLLSTVQNQINQTIIPSTHTTPDPLALNQLLAQMLESGCTHCFMEVSSHSVVQHRITGLHFAGGLFTNITHDHLDFHKTFDQYIAAKKGFFDSLPKTAFALVNIDDKRGRVMVQNTKASIKTFAVETLADYKTRIIEDSLYGLQLAINQQEVHFRLIGTFNAYNLTGVYAVAAELGENPEEILMQLSGLETAPGRFQQQVGPQNRIGIVDYAHTPDALQNVLDTISKLKDPNTQVFTIVGCGGNRDAAKRPIMAEIACNMSNRVVLTSDNPRMEDPADILEQMRKGIPPLHFKKTKIIENRREAIAYAVSNSNPGDIILLAGKGHEKYQDIQGIKHYFDDVEELSIAFQSLMQ